jgi:ankyrin repeat protein
MAATRFGLSVPAKILLIAGANPGRCTSGGENALTMAALRGRYDVMKVFADSDHSLDSTDSRGKTALQLAVEMGHSEIQDLLLEASHDQRQRGNPIECR